MPGNIFIFSNKLEEFSRQHAKQVPLTRNDTTAYPYNATAEQARRRTGCCSKQRSFSKPGQA